ncbi:putative FCP1 domain, HAD superfamily protein [Helianthus annuus]|nr:putative FCP1 domain, HAD superfamily protein [Helianthus annuus]
MMKKTVASDNTDHISEEQEEEKETRISLDVSMNKLNLGPKKKLLVLPIGGFLVHRAHRRRPKTIPKNRQPDFCSGIFMIYKRPFCEEFLKFCFERFQVGIWSSAMELVSQFRNFFYLLVVCG